MVAPESLQLSPSRPYSLVSSEEKRLLLSLSPKGRRTRASSTGEREQWNHVERSGPKGKMQLATSDEGFR